MADLDAADLSSNLGGNADFDGVMDGHVATGNVDPAVLGLRGCWRGRPSRSRRELQRSRMPWLCVRCGSSWCFSGGMRYSMPGTRWRSDGAYTMKTHHGLWYDESVFPVWHGRLAPIWWHPRAAEAKRVTACRARAACTRHVMHATESRSPTLPPWCGSVASLTRVPPSDRPCHSGWSSPVGGEAKARGRRAWWLDVVNRGGTVPWRSR
jgi:hypothetical protein